jgi:hypothetical protein
MKARETKLRRFIVRSFSLTSFGQYDGSSQPHAMAFKAAGDAPAMSQD